MDLPNNIQELKQLVNDLLVKQSILEKENAALKEENIQLKARLKADSHNSNRPPSTDGLRKKPALSKIEKSKKGGQNGHKGNTLRMSPNPDTIENCSVNRCTCGYDLSQTVGNIIEKRQVFDLPEPRLNITEYQIEEKTCPCCKKVTRGKFPERVNAPVQYGVGVKTLSVLLNVGYKIPFKKIQLLFKDLFNCPINESTITSANETCYGKLEKTEETIKQKIIDSPTAHFDETGIRTQGKLFWLHTAATPLLTYLFVSQHRGKKALESEQSIIKKFFGWAVHDCWSSYFNFENVNHAICGAHLLREFQGLTDSGCMWSEKFKSFLLEILKLPLSERIVKKSSLEFNYDQLCDIANKAEPPPFKKPGKGRTKRTAGRNLLQRLIKYKQAVLAFAFNPDVPFTNNQAERDIRPAKIKQKISGCFRTEYGAHIYARIEGFISTSRKNQLNIFKELTYTFMGYNSFN